MKKIISENKCEDNPQVFRFNARLLRHSNSAKNGSQIYLKIPKTVSTKLYGMTRIDGTINGHSFRAALEPGTSGGYWLCVNKAMLEGAHADEGDTVKLAILGPEPEPVVPADLQAALAA